MEPLYRRREVRFIGLDQQEVAVAYEHVSEEIQREPLRASADPVEKAFVVVLIAKDGSPPIAGIEHAVERILLVCR